VFSPFFARRFDGFYSPSPLERAAIFLIFSDFLRGCILVEVIIKVILESRGRRKCRWVHAPLPPNPCLSSLLVQAHLRLISAILISWGFCASGGYPNPFVLFCLVELTSEHICGIQAQIIRGFVRNPRPESGEQLTWIPPLIGCLSPNPTEIDACVCDFSSPAWSKAPHVLCVCASCIRSIYRLICVYVLWDCFRWRFCVFCAGPFLFFLAI